VGDARSWIARVTLVGVLGLVGLPEVSVARVGVSDLPGIAVGANVTGTQTGPVDLRIVCDHQGPHLRTVTGTGAVASFFLVGDDQPDRCIVEVLQDGGAVSITQSCVVDLPGVAACDPGPPVAAYATAVTGGGRAILVLDVVFGDTPAASVAPPAPPVAGAAAPVAG
jgi:hypothetical protein